MTEIGKPSSFYYDVVIHKTIGELLDMLEGKRSWENSYSSYDLTEQQIKDVKHHILTMFSRFDKDEVYDTEDEDGKPIKKRKVLYFMIYQVPIIRILDSHGVKLKNIGTKVFQLRGEIQPLPFGPRNQN